MPVHWGGQFRPCISSGTSAARSICYGCYTFLILLGASPDAAAGARVQGWMLERWLDCVLYYSNTISAGDIRTVAARPVMEAMVLILDLVAGIIVQLHRDLPRTEHLLEVLTERQLVREQLLPTAFDRLANAAVLWRGGRAVLEELLLGQGMLLRWLAGAEFLPLRKASDLVALTCSTLLQQPVAAGPVLLAVDEQVARQVRGPRRLPQPNLGMKPGHGTWAWNLGTEPGHGAVVCQASLAAGPPCWLRLALIAPHMLV
jgi:hypothetical protein